MTQKPMYMELEQRAREFEGVSAKLRETEAALQKATYALGERTKELQCLYALSRLVEAPDASTEGILKRTVELIPSAWQYPEVACARITLNDRDFCSLDCRETGWRQTSDIVVRGKRFGSLEVFYKEERPESDEGPFLEEERQLIDAISARLGRIIERKQAEESLQQINDALEVRVEERTQELKRLSLRLLKAHEKERRRVALELHDGIGQNLGAIKFTLENAIQTMNREDPAGFMEHLEPIIGLVRDAVEEVRRIQRNLRPSILDDLGILATVSWFCREFGMVYPGFRVKRELHLEESDVPDSLKIVIFRIMQEAFNNISKHSRGDLADLTLEKSDGRILLTIRDNGVGFDPRSPDFLEYSQKGLGLTGMKERAELSGGSFSLESKMGVGTTLRVAWKT